MIELSLPERHRAGRVFLEANLLPTVSLMELTRQLDQTFIEEEDQERMDLLERLLLNHESLQVTVFPGEETPPVYHAYIRDPLDTEAQLFACVLAPKPVISSLIASEPHVVFETATFQALDGDSSPATLQRGIEAWAGRVWPDLELPRLEVVPWPIEEVHIQALQLDQLNLPQGAPMKLARREENPERKAG